ncbi:MAG TPA: DUF3108 domain-containing protein [bacterium]|nr:DUF3108 domain-containing protein [bacterium]
MKIPAKQLFVGEKLVYKITYLKIPVGEAESEVKEITEMGGRKAYHVITRVRSFPVLHFIYKVQDEHHAYIDIEHLYSLRYEKDLNEGPFHAREIITYDQENHTAHYNFPKKETTFDMPIPENVQDQLSCGYFFRTLEVEPGTNIFIPVNADKKNWSLEVKLHGTRTMKIKGIGEFTALETEPLMPFRGIFVRQGKIRGWMSLDERRIPLKMKVKIPILGNISAELRRYEPGAAVADESKP